MASLYSFPREAATNAAGNIDNPFVISADTAGHPYMRQQMFPTGWVYGNFPSKNMPLTVAGTAPATGTAWATPIYLPEGFVVNKISFVSGTTALGTGTHQWFGLANSSLKVVATTTDDTSTAWTASTEKALQIAKANGVTAGAYQVPITTAGVTEGRPTLMYAVFMVAATTVPTLQCVTTSAWAAGQVPKSGVTDSTSNTTPIASDASVTLAVTANTLVPLVAIQ